MRRRWFRTVHLVAYFVAVAAFLIGGCSLTDFVPNLPTAAVAPDPGQTGASAPIPPITEQWLTITAVGDLLIHLPLVTAAAVDGGHDFRPLLAPAADELRRGDITIANLETTLAGAERGYSGYPMFNSPDALLAALADSGVTVLTTANNHALDRGAEGLRRTLRVAREAGFAVTGTRLSPDEPPFHLAEANGFRVALLAYTYGTNGLPVPEAHLINLIDKEAIADHIELARQAEPDLLLVAMHWGQEYQRQPNEEQRELAAFLHQQGVDAILGAHPHVVQPIELLGPGPETPTPTVVIYSMGNFVSNQRFPYTDTGIVVHLTYKKTNSSAGESTVALERVDYMPVWVHRFSTEGRVRYEVLPKAEGEVVELLGGPSPIYARPASPLLTACAVVGIHARDCPE